MLTNLRLRWVAMLFIISFFIEQSAQSQSIKIATTSTRDSLVFNISPEGKRIRMYFDNRLYADMPTFKQKTFVLQPQKKWECIGVRDTPQNTDIIIYSRCTLAYRDKLRKLYQAQEVPII